MGWRTECLNVKDGEFMMKHDALPTQRIHVVETGGGPLFLQQTDLVILMQMLQVTGCIYLAHRRFRIHGTIKFLWFQRLLTWWAVVLLEMREHTERKHRKPISKSSSIFKMWWTVEWPRHGVREYVDVNVHEFAVEKLSVAENIWNLRNNL